MRDYIGVSYAQVEDVTIRRALSTIDYYLHDLNRGIGLIQKGQVPNGSGLPIATAGDDGEFFLLAGRSGGQIGSGATESGGSLTLHSTSHPTRGKIFLGNISAYDEANVRLGIGLISPAAVLDLQQSGSLSQGQFVPNNTGGSPGAWVGQDGGSSLQTYVSELSPDDSNYIRNPNVGATNTDVLRMSTVTPTPGTSDVVVLKWRVRWSGSNRSSGGCSFQVFLNNSSGTNIFTSAGIDISTTNNGVFGTYTHTLTAAEITAMSTWSNIRIGFQTAGGGAGYSGDAQVSWVQITSVSSSNLSNLTNWFDTTGALVTRVDQLGNLCLGVNASSGMLHAQSRLVGTVPIWLQLLASQTADFLRIQDSANTTALAGITAAGAYYLVAGAGSGKVFVSDANGVGSWVASTALTASFKDSLFSIVNAADTTKKLAFSCVGITTATTRTLTIPDQSGTIALADQPTTVTGAWIFGTAGSGNQDITITTALSGSGAGGLYFNDSNALCQVVSGGLTTNRTITLPDLSGTLMLTGNSYTLLGGAASVFLSNTGTAGAAFTDVGTSSKKLRFLLSTAVGNNVIAISSTAARTYTTQDLSARFALVGNTSGAPASGQLGQLDLTNQGAAIASTNLSNSPPAGAYLVTYYLEDTTSDVTAGTLTFQVNYTDTVGATNQTSATLALTSTAGRVSGVFMLKVASGNISYQTNLTGIIGAAKYALQVRVVAYG